jgi:transposase-like protein
MKNKYVIRSKISEAKFRLVVKGFSLDLTATQTAILARISRNAVNRLYSAIRRRIAEYNRPNDLITGEFEVDESYFGPRRIKGKRGRGAGSKTIVFGLYKRSGMVYTEIVPDVKSATLSAIIRGRADIESVIHTDGWRGYDGLVDLGYEKHFRVNHGDNEFSDSNGNHINGIESFWGYAKHRLVKFKGISKDKFQIHLLETEFRFNHRHIDLYHFLLKMFRIFPLSVS